MMWRRITGATHRFGPPVDWEVARQGLCGDLDVRISVQEGGEIYCDSAWEPTPEELAALQAGGSLILRIVGHQPVVSLYVEQPTEDQAG